MATKRRAGSGRKRGRPKSKPKTKPKRRRRGKPGPAPTPVEILKRRGAAPKPKAETELVAPVDAGPPPRLPRTPAQWAKLLRELPGFDPFRDAGRCWFDRDGAKHAIEFFHNELRHFKGEHAGRTVRIVNERNTTRACSGCGALSGPTGPDSLVVRRWVCATCGEAHDRDVNAARNILTVGLRGRASVRGNESPDCERPPSQIILLREAGPDARNTAA